MEDFSDSGDLLRRPLCIVGLGNPGRLYEGTPHNVGFLVVDELAKRHGIQVSRKQSEALTGAGQVGHSDVVLVKPQTFMNLSGTAVGGLLNYRNLTSSNLIVIYDELDLPWSALRIKKNGSAAGHNGVKSIIAALNTDHFVRLRVGIHPGRKIDAAEYVLAPWERDLRAEVEEVVSYTADAVESIVAEGDEKAMATYNRRARSINEEEE